MHSSARFILHFFVLSGSFSISMLVCSFVSLRTRDDDALYQAQRFIENRNSSNSICMP